MMCEVLATHCGFSPETFDTIASQDASESPSLQNINCEVLLIPEDTLCNINNERMCTVQVPKAGL